MGLGQVGRQPAGAGLVGPVTEASVLGVSTLLVWADLVVPELTLLYFYTGSFQRLCNFGRNFQIGPGSLKGE